MTIYQGPIRDSVKRYRSKFIRVGDEIFVTLPNDTNARHDDLVQEHNLEARINELRTWHPNDVDGGFISVVNGRTKGGTIEVELDTLTYGLPVELSRARGKL